MAWQERCRGTPARVRGPHRSVVRMSLFDQPKANPITIETRKGSRIPCKPRDLRMTEEELQRCRRDFERDYRRMLQFPDQVIERRGPTYDYNCHGLTFLCRRAWLDEDV